MAVPSPRDGASASLFGLASANSYRPTSTPPLNYPSPARPLAHRARSAIAVPPLIYFHTHKSKPRPLTRALPCGVVDMAGPAPKDMDAVQAGNTHLQVTTWTAGVTVHEYCLLNAVCTNSEELWDLNSPDFFECEAIENIEALIKATSVD